MTSDDYKMYTVQAKTAIKGEAFFESLVSDYCIPHRVVGPKDIGIDYICEWVHGDKPSGILFAVQVKTFSRENQAVRIEDVGVELKLNGLRKYRIVNSNLRVDTRTLHYWHGLGMPIYMFAIVKTGSSDAKEVLNCYYKRYTSALTRKETGAKDPFEPFYLVNKGTRFMAFKNESRRSQGFARDLFIDHVRWCYYNGSISFLDPGKLGLGQFSGQAYFLDLFRNYEDQIRAASGNLRDFLNRIDGRRDAPGAAE